MPAARHFWEVSVLQDKQERQDIYVIPPNFIESGTFFGGMLKIRNTFEAGVLALGAGVPVLCLGVSLTAKIIILCFTALPLGILALVGISGESLSSFAFIFIKYLRNRRIVGQQPEQAERGEGLERKKKSRRKKK